LPHRFGAACFYAPLAWGRNTGEGFLDTPSPMGAGSGSGKRRNSIRSPPRFSVQSAMRRRSSSPARYSALGRRTICPPHQLAPLPYLPQMAFGVICRLKRLSFHGAPRFSLGASQRKWGKQAKRCQRQKQRACFEAGPRLADAERLGTGMAQRWTRHKSRLHQSGAENGQNSCESCPECGLFPEKSFCKGRHKAAFCTEQYNADENFCRRFQI